MKPITFILAFLIAFQIQCQSAPAEPKPHAAIRGNVVRLVPSNFTFSIPDAWVQWNKSHTKSLHLSRQEIDKAEKAEGEWDRPFSEIVNSIFPIERCAAHVGGDGWGRDSASFGDVQMRAYVGAWSVAQIEGAVKKSGTAAASKHSNKVSFAHSRVGQWQVSKLSYHLWYGDYGGTARIDVYARSFGKQAVALVFMYTDASDKKEIAQIIKSFKAKK